MNGRRSRAVTLAALVVLGLLASGCGGSTNPMAPTTSTPASPMPQRPTGDLNGMAAPTVTVQDARAARTPGER